MQAKVLFQGFRFTQSHNATFTNVELVNCVFENNMMNTDFINCRLTDCTFKGSMMNTNFINSPTINCVFEKECQNTKVIFTSQPKVVAPKKEYYTPKELNFGED